MATAAPAVQYQPGDVILAADPLVHVLSPKHRGKHCHNCYKTTADCYFNGKSNLSKCARCEQFFYCSKECQVSDWNSFHKHGECKLFQLIGQEPPDRQVVFSLVYMPLFLRTISLLKANPDLLAFKYLLPDGVTCKSLMDVDSSPDTGEIHTCIYFTAMATLRARDKDAYASMVLDFFLVFFHRVRNAFLIIRDDLELGLGLYIPSAFIPHSCAPNAAYVFEGKRLVIRAMKPIYEGEKVTIDKAGVLVKTRVDRIFQLREWRGFLCECDRCEHGDLNQEYSDLTSMRFFVNMVKTHINDPSYKKPGDLVFNMMQIMEMERFKDVFHPDLTVYMLMAVYAVRCKKFKTAADKETFNKLIEKLRIAIPITHGLDDPVVSLSRLDRITAEGWIDWSKWDFGAETKK